VTHKINILKLKSENLILNAEAEFTVELILNGLETSECVCEKSYFLDLEYQAQVLCD